MLTYILIGAEGFVLGFIAGVLALCWYQWTKYYMED
jgi:hypothetical protein